MPAGEERKLVRRGIFYAGLLLMMMLAAFTLPIVVNYTRRSVEITNAKRTAEMLYSSRAAYWAVAGFWADVLALALVAFGKGWWRIAALFFGSVMLLWIIASIWLRGCI